MHSTQVLDDAAATPLRGLPSDKLALLERPLPHPLHDGHTGGGGCGAVTVRPLIERCFVRDAAARCTSRELLDDPFLADDD